MFVWVSLYSNVFECLCSTGFNTVFECVQPCLAYICETYRPSPTLYVISTLLLLEPICETYIPPPPHCLGPPHPPHTPSSPLPPSPTSSPCQFPPALPPTLHPLPSPSNKEKKPVTPCFGSYIPPPPPLLPTHPSPSHFLPLPHFRPPPPSSCPPLPTK